MTPTRRRKVLVRVLLASGVLFAAIAAIDELMWREGGPGIIGFELAGSRDDAQDILAEWGGGGRDAARASLLVDFLYLVTYATTLVLGIRAAGAAAGRRGWDRLARFARRGWVVPIVAAGFDVGENVTLLAQVEGADGAAWPVAALVFATVKFAAVAVSVGYLLVVLARVLYARWPRGVRQALAGLAALGVLVVALNTWLVERATEPAKPDIGRVLELPAGDVQVREDGPRTAPPLVLIHGFAASMRWFDAVAPALARDFHVIRIDLLGHGGSEKPRDGYSMEEQADLVAEVMRRVGVRRPAAVVGHSMGGMVGTALAERHRDRVARLMLIGTPPDDHDDDRIPIQAKAADWPVIGHLYDTFMSRRLLRQAVEGGFAPEFDPPGRLVDDIYGRTTWSAFNGSSDAIVRFWRREPVHRRLAEARVPVTVLLGEMERQTKRSVRLYNSIPGARTVVLEGLDHSPQVEDPKRTAPLIAAFAAAAP